MTITTYNVYRFINNNKINNKVGYTTEYDVRMREYRRNGWTHNEKLSEVKFNDEMFRESNKCIFLKEKINGVNVSPDELFHKIFIEFGFAERTQTFDGGEVQEVFQFNIEKIKNYVSGNTEEEITNNFLKYLAKVVTMYDFSYKKVFKHFQSNQKEYLPYFHQALVSAMKADRFKYIRRLAQFNCARFGKTSWSLKDFVDGDKNILDMPLYWLSPSTSIQNEIKKYSTFGVIEFYDLTDKNVSVSDLPKDVTNKKVVVTHSLCGDKNREKHKEYVKWIEQFPSKIVEKFVDETDYGSSNQKQIDKINSYQKDASLILMSGSGEDKIIKNWNLTQEEIDAAIDIEYEELILMAKGKHAYQTVEYLNNLKNDSEKNEHTIAFLERYHNVGVSEFQEYSNLIEPVHVHMEYSGLLDKVKEEFKNNNELTFTQGTSFSKINSNPKMYASLHKAFWRQFLDLGTISSGMSIDRITSEFKDDVRCIGVWTSCQTNSQLDELADVIASVENLSDYYVVEKIYGEETTNKDAELHVKNIISRLPEGKKLILLRVHMSARSYSVSEHDMELFYMDSINSNTFRQKSARGLTPGNKLKLKKNAPDVKKQRCYIVHASFYPEECITEKMYALAFQRQVEKGHTIEKVEEIIPTAISMITLTKDAKIKVCDKMGVDNMQRIKNIVENNMINAQLEYLHNVILDIPTDLLKLFDFEGQPVKASELKNLIDKAKAKINTNKNSNEKSEDNKTISSEKLRKIKENIINHVCNSYYDIYLLYSKDHQHNGDIKYKTMFEYVMNKSSNLFLGSFEPENIPQVSKLIKDISDKLDAKYRIYEQCDKMLRSYLKKLYIRSLNKA